MTDTTEPDQVQFCAFCAEPFPIDDPMVDYDGNTYCSPNCVRELLANEDPCNHAEYVGNVVRFQQALGDIFATDRGSQERCVSCDNPLPDDPGVFACENCRSSSATPGGAP